METWSDLQKKLWEKRKLHGNQQGFFLSFFFFLQGFRGRERTLKMEQKEQVLRYWWSREYFMFLPVSGKTSKYKGGVRMLKKALAQ